MEKAKKEMREESGRREHKKRHDRDRPRRSDRQPATETFCGKHKDLQGWVYTYDTAARAYQYAKTTEAITEWVKLNMRYPMDIWGLMTTLKEPDQNEWLPKQPTNIEDEETRKLVFSGEIKKYMKRKEEFENNRCNVFSIVLGQCSDSLQSKLKGQDGWEAMYEENDLQKLMKSVKVWMLNTEGSRCPTAAADAALAALYRLRQNRYESLDEYRKRFTAATEVLEHIDVNLQKALVGLADKCLKENGSTRTLATSAGLEEAEKKAFDKFLACRFISAADKARYANVMIYLENEFVAGSDKFPKDVTTAYNYLENLKRGVFYTDTPSNDGVSFAQSEGSADRDGRDHQAGQPKGTKDRSHIQCFRCGEYGHYQNEGKCKPEDIERWKQSKKGTMNHMAAADNKEHDSDEHDSDDDYYRPVMCTTHATMETNEAQKVELSDGHGARGAKRNTGHIVNESGERVESVMTHSFNSKRAYVIPEGYVGLDSMSSVDVFGDKRLLSNIRTVKEKMTIVCNAGAVVVTQTGDLDGYGPVWYHPGAIANILSLSNVQRQYRIRYDSKEGDFFTLVRPDGTTRIFSPTKKGLYASQLAQPEENVAMVVTVEGNKKEFTKREVKLATQARKMMAIIGRPSESHMREIVSHKQLQNCDVSEQDVRNALTIFGPDLGSLKGKTVRRGETHVELATRPIPQGIVDRHREVTIGFDVMYVNSIAFAVSICRALKFGTAEAIKDRKAGTLLSSIKRIQATYARRGFRMNMVAGDNEFATLEGPLSNAGISLNVVSADEHVPEIERHIRTLKERCRAMFNTLPFRRMPNRMIVEMVYAVNFWLHAFPARDGVSAHISPRELVTGRMLDARKHCVIAFGTYVQTHEPHDNTMASRTVGAIALRPTGNAQGGHYFLSLATGRLIVRNHWTELPAPADAIERVEKLAENKNTNHLIFGDRHNVEQELEESADAISIMNSDDDESDDNTISDADSEPHRTNQDADPGMHVDDPHAREGHEVTDLPTLAKQEDMPIKTEPATATHLDDDLAPGEPRAAQPNPHDAKDDPHENAPDEPDQEWIPDASANDDSADGDADEAETFTPPPSAADPTQRAGARRSGTDRNRRITFAGGDADDDEADDTGSAGVPAGDTPTQRTRAPSQRIRRPSRRAREATEIEEQAARRKQAKNNTRAYLMAQMDTTAEAPIFDAAHLAGVELPLFPLVNTLLTQYGIKKGLRAFGKEGDDAVSAEMQQLHDLKVMQPKASKSLSQQQRRNALQYLMFLKRKRDGRIKGRGCADGRKQRANAVKGEASSPTISTEAVFLILTIAAKEGRDVMVMDIPGAFLQTELKDECVHVRFVGRMAELLVLIDPKLYRPHVIMEKGKPVLYAELKRALYGMLQSALRFWEQVLEDLTRLGFEVNPYDWCVANRTVNGSQQTVGWHVDDFIITHKVPSVNEELAAWFNTKYGQRTPVAVHRGKTHDYLGMQLDFTTPGKVKVTMVDYIDQLLDEAPQEFPGTAPTPAARHLFDTSDDASKLSDERSATLHHFVAKSLYLAKRARPDIQLTVAFLCTRVQDSDAHDWKKLGRLIQYLRGTKELALTLEASEGHIIKWWVDSAFAVTQDMRSQSGGIMTLGKGAVYSSSTRQRLNTRSSTEAELVGANDFMPQILWTRYFLQEQGYEVRENILYQDNQSAMLLETNGKGSSGKRTRHINIRYFFICDRVASGELSVKFCPTEDMMGDFFTKPLQGAPFRRFRDQVLNIEA